MNKFKNIGLSFISWLFLTSPVLAQSGFENENLFFKYDPYCDLSFNYQIAESIDSFYIYCRLDFKSDIHPDNEFHFFYELRKNYTDKPSPSVTTLNAGRDCIMNTSRTLIFDIRVFKSPANELLVMHVSKNSGEYHYQFEVPLANPAILSHSDIIINSFPTRVPVTGTYMHEGDSILLTSVNPGIHTAIVFRYPMLFAAADPPMYLIEKKVNKSFLYDTVFIIDLGKPFPLTGQGLYFIQSDSSRNEGQSIRCEEAHYPKLVTLDEIFEPIIYMSTREEIEKLKSAEDKKSSFEDYWLKMTKSEEKARKIIRAYYKKIEDANNFFTSYKEGWKSDMGLIYMFFGVPDQVFNDGLSEKWFYSKKGDFPAINFKFDRMKSVFSYRHFILIRDSGYKSQWFKRVDTWRKGIVL